MIKTTTFNVSGYLNTEADCLEYIRAVFEDSTDKAKVQAIDDVLISAGADDLKNSEKAEVRSLYYAMISNAPLRQIERLLRAACENCNEE